MGSLVALTECDQDEMRHLLGPWKQGQPKLKTCFDLYRGQGTVVSPSWTPQPNIKATQVCFGYNTSPSVGPTKAPAFFHKYNS